MYSFLKICKTPGILTDSAYINNFKQFEIKFRISGATLYFCKTLCGTCKVV